MTTTIMTQVKPINGAAARRLARIKGAVPRPGDWDDLADGIEQFIQAVETLYAPNAPDMIADLDATRMTVGGNTVWICKYGDGVGDGPDWSANASWYEQEVPGLMHALGVRLDVSTNVWGNSPAHTVP